MSEFSLLQIERSRYDGDGFAATYDAARPSPPASVLDVLEHLAGSSESVVDLGTGTGLSARAWVERAGSVVGVEANEAMVDHARAVTSAANVRFVHALANDTGLEPRSADLVTCAQAFHWMEPGPVLAEAARLLRPGGLFAAYDYDWPPAIEPEIDAAFAAHQEARTEARRRLGLEAGAVTWPKTSHVAQIGALGRFRDAREVVCHGWDEVDAERVVGLAESIGGPRAIFGDDAPEVGATFERLRETARRVLGERRLPMLLGYRLRVGRAL